MKRSLLILVVLVAAVAVSPRAQVRADVALRAAIELEMVKGDLKRAIEAYRRIVDGYPKDRAVQAQALVRMGDCLYRLGDAEARKQYERVLRQFPDQPAAVEVARANLARESVVVRGAAPRLQRVWRARAAATPLPDGRFVSYDEDRNLVILPAAGGRGGRVLTEKKRGATDHSSGWLTSRDGSQIAYNWYTDEKNRYELRLAGLAGVGMPQSRTLLDNPDYNVVYPRDWSPDGRWLALTIHRKDRTSQLALLSVADRVLRVLRSDGWDSDSAVFFSPDGRHLAFDRRADSAAAARDVFTLTVDASAERNVVEHAADDRVVGWSPDGRLLLFASDRKGTRDLWGQPVHQGTAAGVPTLLYAGLGTKSPVGVSGQVVLHFTEGGQENEVVVASIDLKTGKTLVAPRVPAPRFNGSNVAPDWSRDGKYLAYASRREDVDGGATIVIHDAMSDAVVRELRPGIGYPNWLRWSPDSASLLVSASDSRGRIGVIRVDASTGEASTISAPRDDFWRGFRPEWALDGRHIYYRLPGPGDRDVISEHDLETGAERHVRLSGDPSQFVLSPDGLLVASSSSAGESLMIHPIDGSEARRVVTAGANARFANVLAWTPDGRAIIARRVLTDTPDDSGFVVVPVSSGLVIPLELRVPGVRIHPDGQRIAFTAQTTQREVWALENLFPVSSAHPR